MFGGRFVLASFALLLGPCDKGSSDAEPSVSVTIQARPVEEIVLEEARASCKAGDCASGYARAKATIPPDSPFAKSPAYRELELLWAKEVLDGADGDPDPALRLKSVKEVATTPTLDPRTRERAATTLAGLEKRAVPKSETAFEKEWRLASYEANKAPRLLEGRALSKSPKEARAILLPRVAAGMAYYEEAELLQKACERLKDTECANRVAAELPSFPKEIDELERESGSDPTGVRATLLRRIKEGVSSAPEGKLLAEVCAKLKDETCLRRKK